MELTAIGGSGFARDLADCARRPRQARMLRAAVLSLVLLVASAQPIAAAPTSAAPPAIGCTTPTAVTAGPGGAEWVPLVQQGLAWLCGHVGPLNAPVQVSVGPNTQGGAWPFAAVSPVGTAAGSLSNCPITIETLAGVNDSNARMATITHELWHCYEAQIMGVGAFTNASNAHPLNVNGASWLIEGSAEWVGECSVGDCSTHGSFISGQWWDQYLSNPQTPLFQRGYDAIGFYAHMQESGISPFDRLPAMLTAGSDPSAFAAAQVDDRFLETWAGGYARAKPWDPVAWDTTGPGITATQPSMSSTTMSEGASATDDIDAYSNDIGAYALTADVVTISVSFDGHAELHTADGTTLAGPALNGSFCTAMAGCALPPDCSYAGPPLGQLAAGDAELAVNGGTSGSRLTITAMSLADFCASTPSAQPVPAPTTQPATSAGTNCSVGYPVTGESDRQEPGLCVLGVQGAALVEVLAHPDAAQALYAMATQNAGDTPTSCEQLSTGSPEPFLTSGAPPPAKANGALGSLQCAYEPNYPQSHYKDVATVEWFSSASQAEQAYSQAEQFLQRRGPAAP